MASILVKWGQQSARVSLPAVAAGEVETVSLTVTCQVRKVVWCKARSSVDEDLECDVKKEAKLASLGSQIEFTNSVAMYHICTGLGRTSDLHAGVTHCSNIQVNELLTFVNATSPHDACASVVKLL